MPRAGMMWRHVVISTRGAWLHGDPRGFRSRDHRIHSSGDYKNPPPTGEHAPLHRHMKSRCHETVVIPDELRVRVGKSIIASLEGHGCRALAIAVSATHVHIVAELPTDRIAAGAVIGKAKHAASYLLRHRLPGAVWARGGSFTPIRDPDHQRRTYKYILSHEEKENAWVWSGLPLTAHQT